jgi:hypothetical protein
MAVAMVASAAALAPATTPSIDPSKTNQFYRFN